MLGGQTDFNQVMKDKPLIDAILNRGDLDEIKRLVAEGANVNARNAADCSALELAGNMGRVDIMRFLHEHGATVRTKGFHGDITFSRAVQLGHVDVLQFYIDHGVDLNATGPLSSSIVHWAVTCPDPDRTIEILQLLKANDGLQHLNHGDFKDTTPLIMAVIQNKKKVCQWLLAEGADPNLKDDIDNDAVYYAKHTEKPGLVTLLTDWIATHPTQINQPVLTDEAIDTLAHIDEAKRQFLRHNKDALNRILRENITVVELASAKTTRIQAVIAHLNKLDDILAVATIKQLLHLDPTPITLPKTFKVQLKSVFGSAPEIRRYGHKDYLQFRTHGQHTSVYIQDQSLYRSAWVFARGQLQSYLDRIARTCPLHAHYINRWVKLPLECIHTDLFKLKQEDSEWPSKTFKMKVVNFYYSPDSKQIICEQISKGFPYETVTEQHAYGLRDNPFYHEKLKYEMVERSGFNYQSLRQIPGMTQEKLLILTHNLKTTKALRKLLPLTELVKIDSRRLQYLIEHYKQSVKPALQLITLRKLAGLTYKPPVAAARASEGGLFDRTDSDYEDMSESAMKICTLL